MAGRPAKPIDIHMAGGNVSHLTKAEIEGRKKAEIKFGEQKLVCPDYVKKDPQANEKWKEISALYADVDFVASGDITLMGRYCMTFSEYLDLISRRGRIDAISEDSDDVEEYISDSEEFDYRLKKKLMGMCSTTAVLNLDTAINKKMDMLIKMEDRLFLNPLAKLKNVSKPPEEEPVSKWDKYKSG